MFADVSKEYDASIFIVNEITYASTLKMEAVPAFSILNIGVVHSFETL
jgi:hypothetical protein